MRGNTAFLSDNFGSKEILALPPVLHYLVRANLTGYEHILPCNACFLQGVSYFALVLAAQPTFKTH